jgi:lipopolysaccharide transport system permease protein
METASKHEYVILPGNSSLLNWKELWEYRELFYFFTWRDVKVKYKQTVLGFLWVILQPAIMVSITTFALGDALNIKTTLPYPVFVFSGFVLWNFFSAGVNNAGNSMVSHANIIKKIYFPRLVIPLSAIISAGFDMLITMILFIAALFFFPVSVDLSVMYFWPLAILVAAVTAVGMGCWLSALMVKYRDFRYIIPFLIQAFFFLTPIIYPVSNHGHRWINYIIALNPMYVAITFFRWPLSAEPIDPNLMTISLTSCLILFVGGTLYFKKTEKYFADLA